MSMPHRLCLPVLLLVGSTAFGLGALGAEPAVRGEPPLTAATPDSSAAVVVSPPSLADEIADALAAERAAAADVAAELAVTTDAAARLELTRRLESLKREAEIAILEARARAAERGDRAETAANLREAVALLKAAETGTRAPTPARNAEPKEGRP